jgi:hypothetical protein
LHPPRAAADADHPTGLVAQVDVDRAIEGRDPDMQRHHWLRSRATLEGERRVGEGLLARHGLVLDHIEVGQLGAQAVLATTQQPRHLRSTVGDGERFTGPAGQERVPLLSGADQPHGGRLRLVALAACHAGGAFLFAGIGGTAKDSQPWPSRFVLERWLVVRREPPVVVLGVDRNAM